jgi:hypothetical protein
VIVGFGASSSPLIPNAELGLNLVSSTSNSISAPGTYTAVGDATAQPGLFNQPGFGGNIPNVQFTGQYRLLDPAAGFSQGYGVMQFPAALFGDFSYEA